MSIAFKEKLQTQDIHFTLLLLLGGSYDWHGGGHIPANKVEVDFNLLRSFYAAFSGTFLHKDWYGVEYCETPEDLRDELLSSYRMNEAEKITQTRRELTEEETLFNVKQLNMSVIKEPDAQTQSR